MNSTSGNCRDLPERLVFSSPSFDSDGPQSGGGLTPAPHEHPSCGLEINLRRLKSNPRVRVLTLAEVVGIEGSLGAYTAILKLRPRVVNENCTACGDCAAVVSSEIANPYTYGLDRIKAAHLPHAMAYPQRYVLDPSLIGTADADRASAACKVGAIDLTMQEQSFKFAVGAVVWATGWNPYDAARIQPYGYGRFPNVITSLEFERLADPGGPTGGNFLRPSDGKGARPMSRSIDQVEINRKHGTKLNMPVLYCSQLMTVAYGGSAKEAGLDGHLIQPTKLQEIAQKK